MELSSADGALAEDWPVVVSAVSNTTQGSFAGEAAVADIAGTLTVELLDPMLEDLTVGVSGLFAAGTTSGGLQIFARSPEPNGPAITAPLATWPAP